MEMNVENREFIKSKAPKKRSICNTPKNTLANTIDFITIPYFFQLSHS